MKAELNYSVCGTGENIVMIHGWGMHAGIWQMIVPELSQEFRVTLIDLPGYGDNKILSEGHTLLEIGEKISSIVSEESIVLGWSMGGLIAMWLAIYYPHLVNKLILTNSTPCFVNKDNWPGIELSILNDFKRDLSKDLERTMSRFIALQVNMANYQEARCQLQFLKNIIYAKEKYQGEVLTQGLDILLNTDLRSQLTKIKVPILWLLGEHDRLVPAAVKESLRFYLPQAQIEVMRNAAHMPFISHSQDFLKIVLDFIHAK